LCGVYCGFWSWEAHFTASHLHHNQKSYKPWISKNINVTSFKTGAQGPSMRWADAWYD